MPGHDLLTDILKNWGIDFRKVRNDLPLSGSPERSLRRFVIEDKDGILFVLDLIAPDQLSRREEMGEVLTKLKQRGLHNIQTYLPSVSKGYLVFCGADVYQLGPYVEGAKLIRPGYIFDDWRGISLGDFLVNLKKAASLDLPLKNREQFSIFEFIDDLQRKMRQLDPDMLSEIEDIIVFLNKNFRKIHDEAPVIFCHGDFHPLNVIWLKNGIAAVIDWEFMSIKPEFYDVANLIGCVGMEDPKGLVGGLARHFLATLDRARFLSPFSRKYLPEAFLALRFAWLSVWLRKKDRKMVDLEIHYLRLIKDNMTDLRYSWGSENY